MSRREQDRVILPHGTRDRLLLTSVEVIEFSVEDKKRLDAVARLFGVDEASTAAPNLTVIASARPETQAKAS